MAVDCMPCLPLVIRCGAEKHVFMWSASTALFTVCPHCSNLPLILAFSSITSFEPEFIIWMWIPFSSPPLLTAKNGRIFPWAEFSDYMYYSTSGWPLVRWCWSTVHSAVCSETLCFLGTTGGNYPLSMFDTACCSLWSTNPKTKQTENVATHLQGSEIRLWKESDIQCFLFIHFN